jgi:hypothetical protein
MPWRQHPCSKCWTAASLNSLVNILLDNPMTQFSFEWISSLNQKTAAAPSVLTETARDMGG